MLFQEWSALDDTVKDIQASLEELAIKGEGGETQERKEMVNKSHGSESESESEEDEDDMDGESIMFSFHW